MAQIQASGYVLCWAAKWLGAEEILFDSIQKSHPKKMLRGIHKLLDEADAVIHYHGSKFDIPTLNKEFVLHKLTPPSNYKQIDLLKTMRQQFKFPSNKLDYVAQMLGVGGKYKLVGNDLWPRCMAKDPEAWEEMEKYNKHDVVILEQVYQKVLPWIKDHANLSLYEDKLGCPVCWSESFQRRGFSYTKTAKYARYQCKDCGHWFRGGKSLAKGPEEKFVSL